MLPVPKRLTLADQTATILRRALAEKEWTEALPSERNLCARLHVSRGTLRIALESLKSAGLIATSRGRATRPAATPSLADAARRARRARRVCLVSSAPLGRFTSSALYMLAELRRLLEDEGVALDFTFNLRLAHGDPSRLLDRLAGQSRGDGWILHMSTPAMQAWFEQRGLPALIWGQPFEGVGLDSVSLHYRAICRHAAGMFRRMGHRRAMLLLPKDRWAGTVSSEVGFLEGFAQGKPGEEPPLMARHEPGRTGVLSLLDATFSRTGAPSGILVAHPNDVLTVLTHLMRRGLRIPRDVSLISRADDPALAHVAPSIACYSYSRDAFAASLARSILRILHEGRPAPGGRLIVPRFKPGDSLGRGHGSPPSMRWEEP